MATPRFSAESALYRSSAHYHTLASVAETSGIEVLPAMPALPVGDPPNPLSPTGPICMPPVPICCEYDAESHKCIGGCCATEANCCPDGKPGIGNKCTNFGSDPANCGRCNNPCPSG